MVHNLHSLVWNTLWPKRQSQNNLFCVMWLGRNNFLLQDHLRGLCEGQWGKTATHSRPCISVCVWVCVFMCPCVAVWVSICEWMCVCVPVSVHVSINLSLYVSVWIFVCESVSIFVHMSVCVCVCVCVCVSMCMGEGNSSVEGAGYRTHFCPRLKRAWTSLDFGFKDTMYCILWYLWCPYCKLASLVAQW